MTCRISRAKMSKRRQRRQTTVSRAHPPRPPAGFQQLSPERIRADTEWMSAIPNWALLGIVAADGYEAVGRGLIVVNFDADDHTLPTVAAAAAVSSVIVTARDGTPLCYMTNPFDTAWIARRVDTYDPDREIVIVTVRDGMSSDYTASCDQMPGPPALAGLYDLLEAQRAATTADFQA